MHIVVIPKPYIHHLPRSIEAWTAHRCDVTLMALSTGGAEFRLAQWGCQLRQPHNLCVMLDRRITFGIATQLRSVMSLVFFSMSKGDLPDRYLFSPPLLYNLAIKSRRPRGSAPARDCVEIRSDFR
jgi:hypothetical protein